MANAKKKSTLADQINNLKAKMTEDMIATSEVLAASEDEKVLALAYKLRPRQKAAGKRGLTKAERKQYWEMHSINTDFADQWREETLEKKGIDPSTAPAEVELQEA